MAFQNPVGPQPDTQRMVQSHRIFGEELAKLPNVPAIAQGNALQYTLDQILTQLTQTQHQLTQLTQTQQTQLTQINARFDQVNVRLDQVNIRLDALTLRISTNEHNNMARVQNALLTKSTDRLELLRNPSNNTVIQGYPTTPGDIVTMEEARLNSVLEQLGLPRTGVRATKEKRLRQGIGLPPVSGP